MLILLKLYYLNTTKRPSIQKISSTKSNDAIALVNDARRQEEQLATGLLPSDSSLSIWSNLKCGAQEVCCVEVNQADQ